MFVKSNQIRDKLLLLSRSSIV